MLTQDSISLTWNQITLHSWHLEAEVGGEPRLISIPGFLLLSEPESFPSSCLTKLKVTSGAAFWKVQEDAICTCVPWTIPRVTKDFSAAIYVDPVQSVCLMGSWNLSAWKSGREWMKRRGREEMGEGGKKGRALPHRSTLKRWRIGVKTIVPLSQCYGWQPLS